jgi:putative DNA methylase
VLLATRLVLEIAFAAEADKQIADWGIEHNQQGERADAFLYCVEVKPEGCEYYIPLAPTWLIGEKSKVVATWKREPGSDRLIPEISVVASAEIGAYKNKKGATAVDNRVIDPFDATRSWSMESLRGPNGLRKWTNEDVVPRPDDVFQERLYCIRWIDSEGKRRYAAPDSSDLAREAKVLELLYGQFDEWQRVGFIPSKAIVSGYNTEQPIRERGWTHWHHLFTPRQLLTHGTLSAISDALATSKQARVACLLGLGRMADWNSRLSAWMFHAGNEKGNQVFYNQALNCHLNYSARPLPKLRDTFEILGDGTRHSPIKTSTTALLDARACFINRFGLKLWTSP